MLQGLDALELCVPVAEVARDLQRVRRIFPQVGRGGVVSQRAQSSSNIESTMLASDEPFRWKSLALPVLLPTLLFTTAEGAIIPLIPALAKQLGANLAVSGLVAAMMLVGHLVADVPAGWIVARLGERVAMLGALGVAAVGLALAAFAPTGAVLGLAVGLVGMAAAVFALARHSLVTTAVPRAYRARALSTLGGTYRLGHVLGPFLAAVIITISDGITTVFWFCLVMLVLVAASLVLLPDAEGILRSQRVGGEPEVRPLDVFRTIHARRGVLARLGSAGLTVSSVRAVRQVLLPLWAVSIGIGEARIALIIGAAAAIDFVLFYPGGWLMDRYGRLVTSVPPMIAMGLAFLVLALTQGAANPVAWFIGVTLAVAVANGLSAGVLMTMGSDLAGRKNPAPFLGAWRLVLDGGRAGAPLLSAAVTAAFGLAAAASVLGAIALVGAGLLAWFVPRDLGVNRD